MKSRGTIILPGLNISDIWAASKDLPFSEVFLLPTTSFLHYDLNYKGLLIEVKENLVLLGLH